jgi:hypothetical protein
MANEQQPLNPPPNKGAGTGTGTDKGSGGNSGEKKDSGSNKPPQSAVVGGSLGNSSR